MVKGKVYKLYNTVNDKFYIGSTKKMMCIRMAIHRYHAKTHQGGSQLYAEMRSVGIKKWFYEVLEELEFEEIKELRQLEEQYRQDNKCDNLLNQNRAIRTREDINQIAKDYYHVKGHIQAKKRYKKNKDKLLKNQKEYYNNNKDKYRAYYEKVKDTPEYKARQKAYREEYKDRKHKRRSNQKTIFDYKYEKKGFNPLLD